MREDARNEGFSQYEYLSEKLFKEIRTAGKLALSIRERGISSEIKSTKEDIVTEGDQAVSDALQKALTALFPGINIIDEEVAGSENIDSASEDLVAIIDPIDGTTNYFNSEAGWGLSIGFLRKGTAVAGIIYQPATDSMFYAEKGGGAYVNGRRIHVSATRQLEDAHMLHELPYPKDAKEYAHAGRLNDSLKGRVSELSRRGSQVVSAMEVAEGKADAFFCMRTQSWDVAAAIVIAAESGGRVMTANGEPFSLENKTVVIANGSLEMSPFFHLLAATT